MQKKRWQIASPVTPESAQELAPFPPVLQQLLFNRGYANYRDAISYINHELNFDDDPFQMIGMESAVKRIQNAIDKDQLIAIYGDYDVDGVTATALLVLVLQEMGALVIPYIPNRFEEGYGLNRDALYFLKNQGVDLVITVDCGIRSPEECIYAKSINLDVIITDHHQPLDDEFLSAVAVVNPKQKGDPYPDKDLAGVGVAYKISQALAAQHSRSDLEKTPPAEKDWDAFIKNHLDLVALGTVADLAPLAGENRALVYKGLQLLRSSRRQGLFSLAAVSDLNLANTNSSSIGYILGPRLNAAGRLESALAAYELLTTTDVRKAGELAQQLNVQNRKRQEVTREIREQAEAIIQKEDPDSLILFAVAPGFNSGVVGLAASRLSEAYYRPAIVGQVSTDTTRCSCRSIPEFNITQALDQCRDLLLHHGGHAAAAGFTVGNENLAELKTRLKEIAYQKLHDMDLRKTLSVDAEVPLVNLRPELFKELEVLQPTGYGNNEALFASRNVRISEKRTVGSDGGHLKLKVTDGRITFDVIGFHFGHLLSELPDRVDIAYSFEKNEFNGQVRYQLNLKDIQFEEMSSAGKG